MSKHPGHDVPGERDIPAPDGTSHPADGDGPAAAGRSRPQRADTASALARIGRLISALDAVAASLQEARSADVIPNLIGTQLHALGIESHVSLLEEPIDEDTATREDALAAAALRLCYISLTPEMLRQVEQVSGRPILGMTFPLARVTTMLDVVRTHQTRYLDDTDSGMREMLPWLPGSEAKQLGELARTGTAIVAPLLSRGRVLGIMGVWANDLWPEDTPVLGAFARQAGTALDNARLDQDVAQRTRRLETLVDIGPEMTGTLAMDEILTHVVSRAAQALGTNEAVLWLVEDVDDDKESIGGDAAWPPATPVVRLVAAYGISEKHRDLAKMQAPTREVPFTPVLRAVRGVRTVLCRDLESAEAETVSPSVRRFLLEEGYRGFVAAPVVTAANKAIGALVVYARVADTLAVDDGPYLEAIGRLAAGAIEQARLFHQVESGRALLEAVFSADPAAIAVIQWPEDVVRAANPRLRAWSARPDLDPVGQSIHDLFPHTRISLVNGLGATLEGVRHTRRPLTVHGVTLRDAAGEPQRTMALHVAPIPLPHEGGGQETDGAATSLLSTNAPFAGTAANEGLLLLMWDTTAHMRAEAKLAAQVRRAETLSAVAAALESERELPALLRRIAQAARELTDADASGFLLRAAPKAPFEVAALFGVEARIANALRRAFVLNQQVLRPLLEGRQPLLAADVATMVNHSDVRLFMRAKLHSLAATPLIASDGWTMGALVVGHHARGTFTQEHSDLLAGLAAQAGAAIERTRALEEAGRRADELEATFTGMAEGVALYDAGGQLMRMNDAAQRITGHVAAPGEDAAQQRERLAMRLPNGQPVHSAEMPSARAIRGETFHGVEYLVDGENGRDTLVSASGAPLNGLDGGIRGAVVVLRNVTLLRRLERRTQEALDALLGMAATLVAPPERDDTPSEPHADAEQTALRVTLRHLCQLAIGVLGCDRVAIVLVDPETHAITPGAAAGLHAGHEAAWRRWQRDGRAWRRVEESLPSGVVRRFLAGEAVTLDLSQPPYDDEPNPFGVRGVLALPMCVEERLVGALLVDYGPMQTDEPPHLYTPDEVALAEGVARLAALAVERQRLMRVAAEVEALRTANALKQEFLSIASHELKTPLTVLQARTQATQRRLMRMGHTAAAEQFAPVQESLNRMLSLIQELLDASRIEAGRLELHAEACNLGALVAQAVHEAREASDRTITLDGAEVSGLWTRGDRERLMQVLANVISNALKYSPPDSPVVVRIWRQPTTVLTAASATEGGDRAEDEVLVSVSDQGIGIPRDEIGHVFARFYRARTSSPRQYGGLGLGLHIAATIVERHGGRIWAESAGPDRGSTFTVTLPVLEG